MKDKTAAGALIALLLLILALLVGHSAGQREVYAQLLRDQYVIDQSYDSKSRLWCRDLMIDGEVAARACGEWGWWKR